MAAELTKVIASSNGKTVGIYHIDWKVKPSASLSVKQAETLIRQLQAAVDWCKAHDAPDDSDLA